MIDSPGSGIDLGHIPGGTTVACWPDWQWCLKCGTMHPASTACCAGNIPWTTAWPTTPATPAPTAETLLGQAKARLAEVDRQLAQHDALVLEREKLRKMIEAAGK